MKMFAKIKSKNIYVLSLLFSLFLAIPIEHKYDKLFRFYSLSLIPLDVNFSNLFNPLIYFYASDIIGMIFFGVGIWQIRQRYQERGSLFLALLFFGAFFSIVASPLYNYPLAYIHLVQFFTPLALFFFLANNPYPKEQLFKICTYALFTMGLVEGCVTILQYFKQHALGLRFFGEQPLIATIPVPGGRRWLFDTFLQQSDQPMTIFRAMGTMPHPNVMGGFFAITLLITTYFFFVHKKWRHWLIVAYFLQLVAMVTTYSRSAIFAYVISTLIWAAWMQWRKKVSTRCVVALVLISSAITGILFFEQIYFRGGLVNYNNTSLGSDQERLFYQNIAFKMIQKHPLSGVGYGQFALQTADYIAPGVDFSKISFSCVHNIFLLIASEMGLLTLLAFVCWIVWIIWGGWRSMDASAETALLWSAFIGFLFIGCCDYYPIVFQQGKLLFFGIAGLLARFGCFEKKQISDQIVRSHISEI